MAARDARLAGARRASRLPSLPAREPLRIDGGDRSRSDAPPTSAASRSTTSSRRMRARVAPFEIDATPVTQRASSCRFVEAGGYDDADLWPGAAGAWRARQRARASRALAPRRRRRTGRCAGSTAGCRSIRRRRSSTSRLGGRGLLPLGRASPAARGRVGMRRARRRASVWGRSVWEWTADAFLPYPGFAAGPYADYSRPWFGDHRELRGGSFATARAAARPALPQLLRRRPQRRLRRLSHRRPSTLNRKHTP